MTSATMLNKFLCLLWGCSEELYFGKEFIVEYPSGNIKDMKSTITIRRKHCGARK